MHKLVPLSEIESRMERFRHRMDKNCPDWKLVFVIGKVNQYYFTGTMQDGMLIIPRDGEAVLWVRRSYQRAVDESNFPDIRPMESFRDAAAAYAHIPEIVHMETELVPLAMYQRLGKYFSFREVKPVDAQIMAVRSVKSAYELDRMTLSGEIHRRVMEEMVPSMLREGMSEADLATELFARMVSEGHHGISRFGMFDTEMFFGQVCFGESSIYPSYFNGPGSSCGISAAAPILGSRERRLKAGDVVYVDVGCGVDGYHTDKTTTYMFGRRQPDAVIAVQQQCVEVQNNIAAMLKTGAVPSQIYQSVMASLSPEFDKNFMGFEAHRVKFLGHGIGLQVDELPVLAKGFDEPVVEGMVFAVEPKKGIAGVGMVGIENTFMVTAAGGVVLTGTNPGLIPVY